MADPQVVCLPERCESNRSRRAVRPPAPLVARIARRETAFHEAGHFVAARWLLPDMRRYRLSIRVEGEFLGVCRVGQAGNRCSQAICCCAGLEAELALGPTDQGRAQAVRCAVRDTNQAYELVTKLVAFPESHNFVLAHCRRAAARLVREHWAEVERLAENLF